MLFSTRRSSARLGRALRGSALEQLIERIQPASLLTERDGGVADDTAEGHEHGGARERRQLQPRLGQRLHDAGRVRH